MYNWNTVYFPYCDGACYSCSNSTKTIVNGEEIHFQGKNIVDSIIDDLLENQKLKMLLIWLTGGSAGVHPL